MHSKALENYVATEEDLIMRALERNGLTTTCYTITPSGKYIECPTTNFKVSEKTKNKIQIAINELNKKIREFQHSKDYPQWANKFWEENAEKYGMKYSTNMDFSV